MSPGGHGVMSFPLIPFFLLRIEPSGWGSHSSMADGLGASASRLMSSLKARSRDSRGRFVRFRMMDDAEGVSPAAPATAGSPSPATTASRPPANARSIIAVASRPPSYNYFQALTRRRSGSRSADRRGGGAP